MRLVVGLAKATVPVKPYVREGKPVRGSVRFVPSPGHPGQEAWISPTGETFWMHDYDEQKIGSHTLWMRHFHPELREPEAPFLAGWIRAVAHGGYEVGRQEDVARAFALARAHPEVSNVMIDIIGPGYKQVASFELCNKHGKAQPCRLCAAGKATVSVPPHVRGGQPVHGYVRIKTWPASRVVGDVGKAWLGPDGTVIPVPEGAAHGLIAEGHRLSTEAPGSEEAWLQPLRKGWIRQASRTTYTVPDRGHVDRVLDYVRQQYPDVGQVFIELASDQEDGFPEGRPFNGRVIEMCPRHHRDASAGCRLCAAGKSTVQVKPHLRDGHPVRGHVRILKKRADIKNMGRNLWRWTKPEDEWTTEEREQAERTDRSIAEARARNEYPNFGRWLPIEDISAVVTSKAELPPVLYHVTSYRQAIEESGVIRITNSMEQGGLGGVHLATHFCRDRAQAEMIRRELLRAGQIARGEVSGETIFKTWGREDEAIGGLPSGALDAAVAEAERTYGVYANDPGRHLRIAEWEHDLGPPSAEQLATATHEPVEGGEGTMHRFPDGSLVWEKRPDFWIWQMGPIARPWSILNDAYDLYLNARSSAAFRVNEKDVAVLDNPLLLGDSKAFGVATPESIAIIEVPTANIPDEALIVRPNVNFDREGNERNDFLSEVRVFADVPTEHAKFAAKTVEVVKPHLRDGKPVRGYTRYRSQVIHGLPSPVQHFIGGNPSLEILTRTDKFAFEAEPGQPSYHWDTEWPSHEIRYYPHPTPGLVEFVARPHDPKQRRGWYDPALAELETVDPGAVTEWKIPRLKAGTGYAGNWDDLHIEDDRVHVLWRGMNWEEMQGILKTGIIQSDSSYNLGEQATKQHTLFSERSGQAAHYAGGFAPGQHQATFERPSYVVAIARPGSEWVGESHDGEIGLKPGFPVKVLRVFEVRAYGAREGEITIEPSEYIDQDAAKRNIRQPRNYRVRFASDPDLSRAYREVPDLAAQLTRPRIQAAGPASVWRYGSSMNDEELADPDYYHVTTEAAAKQILADQALEPGYSQTMAGGGFYAEYSRDKVFVTKRDGVGFWRDRIEEHLEATYDDPPKLVVLRIPHALVAGHIADDTIGQRDHPSSWIVTKAIEVVKPHLRGGTLVQGYVRDSRNRKVVGSEALQHSVVRDDQGRLLVMFHGTQHAFGDFSLSEAQPGLYGRGIYFTDDPEITTGYASVGLGLSTVNLKDREQTLTKLRAKLAQRRADREAIAKENRPHWQKHGTPERPAEELERGFFQFGGHDRAIEEAERDIAEIEAARPNVRSAYLDIRRPFDVERASDEEIERLLLARSEAEHGELGALMYEGIRESLRQEWTRSPESRQALIQQVIRSHPTLLAGLGYDGITHIGGITMGGKQHRVYIVFATSQIHEAIPMIAKGTVHVAKAIVTKPQLPFAKPGGGERKPVAKPGSRGSSQWFIDKQGHVMYGDRPAPETEARWDDKPDPAAFAERFHHEGATVASPEDREHLSFADVYKRHADKAHHAFLTAATKIDTEAGLTGASELALGDTEEWGTEPSLVTTYQDVPDYATLRYVAAKRGLYSKSPQKAVIAWERDEQAGADHLYSVTVPARASELPKALDKAGLPFRTFVEHENGTTTVHIFHVAAQGKMDDTEASLVIFADGYGGPNVEKQAGRAEFIGADDRKEAGQIYRSIIDTYEAQHHRPGARERPEGDDRERESGRPPAVRKSAFRVVLALARHALAQKSFWNRKEVQNPGSRGSTKWFRREKSGEVAYGEKPQPRAPAAMEAPPSPTTAAPHVTPPHVTTAMAMPRPVIPLGRGSSTGERSSGSTEPAASGEAGRSTRPPATSPTAAPKARPRKARAPKAPKAPVESHAERRAAALGQVELPSFKLTDEPTEADAQLALVTMLKAGILKQNTRGKLKGRLTLDVRAANELRYAPATNESERGLRASLEGLRTYGADPWKPNSADLTAEHGKAYHENGKIDQPLRANLRGDMKIGALMAGLIDRVNAGETDLIAAAQEQKVTRQGLAEREALTAERAALIPELIAAKHQTVLPDGHREDHSTWTPPDFIKVAGKEGLKPRPWQSGACEWAAKAKRGIVGLDMGMGKTAFSVMDFAGRKARGEADQALVFAEINQTYGWKEEFEKWWPGVKVAVLTGDNRDEQLAEIAKHPPDAIVASYGLLSNANTKALDAMTKGKRSAWYFDEARALRDPATMSYKVAKTYLDHRDEAVAAFPLTGTPTPNNPSEAHALLDLLHPGVMGPAAAFKHQHETMVTVGGKKVKSFTNLNSLVKTIEPWSYTKSRFDPDARKILPDLVRVPMKLAMDETQHLEYQKAASGVLNVLANVEDPQKMTPQEQGKTLATITRMRQAAYDPTTYDPGYKGHSAVIDATIHHIDQSLRAEPEHGIVAFAEHVSNFGRIKQRLQDELGLQENEVGIITGQVSAQERSELRKNLNAGKLKVLLAGYGAAGQGMNLQENARRVITMEDPWTWARKDQAIARVHRQGQKLTTEHVSMTVPGTITDKMEETLARKKGLGEVLWGAKESDELVHTALSFDEYLKLAGITREQVNAARVKAGKQKML